MDQSQSEKIKGSRRKIIESAKVEFAEYGLDGGRVDRIADRSGVNKAMIYYHFKNKEGLYVELIDRHIGAFVRKIIERTSDEPDLEKILVQVVETYSDFFTPENSYIAPIFLREMALGGGHFADLFKEAMSKKGLSGKLIEALDRGIVEGKYRAVESRQALISFIGMNLFYYLMSPLVNNMWDIRDESNFREERKKCVIDLFLNGIKVREDE